MSTWQPWVQHPERVRVRKVGQIVHTANENDKPSEGNVELEQFTCNVVQL